MNPSNEPTNNTHDLPVIQVGQIPLEPEPRRWLIEGLWGASAVGFVGGSPKSHKSFLGLDMAVSVASGTPCLGRYIVEEPGPAMVYLAEDPLAVVRKRVAALTRHRGLDLMTIPLHVVTVPRLRLDRPADRDRLLNTAQRLRPRLLLLDPLVRLHGLDENRATEIAQLLSCLRELQRRLDLAVAIVHHTRKYVPPGSQAGQGLRGSGDLWAFADSNLFLRRIRDDLELSMEHRAAAAPDPVGLQLVAADEQLIHLEVVQRAAGNGHQQEHAKTLERAVFQALADGSNITRKALRRKLAVKNERLGRALEQLEHQGRIERCAEGWRLSHPASVPRSPPMQKGTGTHGGAQNSSGG